MYTESVWERFRAEQRESARHYSDLRDALGLAFRDAQVEAHDLYDLWEEQDRMPVPSSPPRTND